MELLDCGHPESEHSSITRGYGTMPDGTKHCYDCCANMDRESMIETGKATLYLADGKITNWPGSLTFPVYGKVRVGRHNMARDRYDASFIGPDGFVWSGTVYGNNTQLFHCKRTKAKR